MDPFTGEAIERGCGVREPGGIYLETVMGPGGSPLENFLFDPPKPLGDLDLPDRGVQFLERPDGSGIIDVYDRVGEGSYPNVADMVEEIRNFGLSRRIGKGADFAQLTPGSLIFLSHPRAIVKNPDDVYRALRAEYFENPARAGVLSCPCNRPRHIGIEEIEGPNLNRVCCSGLWYETIRKGDPTYDPNHPRRTVVRKSGSTTYSARSEPVMIENAKIRYEEGLFIRLPISRIAVIADDEGDNTDALDRAEHSSLPVVELDY